MTQAAPTGFSVILKTSRGFKPITNPQKAQGLRPVEAWIFGSPSTSWEYSILETVMPAIATIKDKHLIHRISHSDPCAHAVRQELERQIEASKKDYDQAREDHWQTIQGTQEVITILTDALRKIAGQDYRGNRPESATIAHNALLQANIMP